MVSEAGPGKNRNGVQAENWGLRGDVCLLVGRLGSRIGGAEVVTVEVLLDRRSRLLLVLIVPGVGAAGNAFLECVDGLLRMLLGSLLPVFVVVFRMHTPSVCVPVPPPTEHSPN